MARGRPTSLTIDLTPAERQTLLVWQRSTTIPSGRARRGRIILLVADGHTDRPRCRDGRDQPSLCLQMGTAISQAGHRGIGRQTWPRLPARVAPPCSGRGARERVTHVVRGCPASAMRRVYISRRVSPSALQGAPGIIPPVLAHG